MTKLKPPKRLFAIGVTVLLFAGGSYLFGWSPLFTVSEIEITGAPTSASQQEISRKLNLEIGDKLARVNSRALSNRLKTSDWIQSADISRNWISGKVSIALHPRIPVALYSEPGKPQVALDALGQVFKSRGPLPDGLPKVSAISVSSGLAAIKVFTALPKEFSDGIDRLSATSERNLLIYGKFNGRALQIIWGDGENTKLKIDVINKLLKQPENKTIRLIDVTAAHAPIVK